MNAVPALAPQQVTTLFDGMYMEFYAATSGADDELTSVEFYERRPDLGEIALVQNVGWKMRAPRAAALRMATAGVTHGPLENLWISWLDGEQLKLASLGQDKPGQLDLVAGERLIDPAIMIAGDVLIQLGWRPDPGSLVAHRIHAPSEGAQMAITSEEIAKMATPVLMAAAPVPGSARDLLHLFTLEAKPGQEPCAVHRVVQGAKLLKETASDPIPGLTPLPPGRLATSVNPKGVAAMAFTARRNADGAAVLVLASFGNREPEVSVGTSVLPDRQQDAVSAHVDFYKRVEELDFLVFAVARNGTLSMAARDLDDARVLRRDVAADYAYPIFMAQGAAYEVQRKADDGQLVAINIAAP